MSKFEYFFKVFFKNVFCSNNYIYLCVTLNQKQLINNTKNLTIMKKLTIREIRRVLFETEKYTVIGSDEMTNKESRDYLYLFDDQEQFMNVIDNKSHLLIWK